MTKKIFIFLLFIIFIFITDLSYSQEISDQITDKPSLSSGEELKSNPITNIKPGRAEGTPVMFYGEELFYVYTDIGPFTSKSTALAISEKIRLLCEMKNFDPELLVIGKDKVTSTVHYEGEVLEVSGLNILYKDHFLMLVEDDEAAAAGITTEELAKIYLKEIKEAIIRYREKTDIMSILAGILYTFVGTILFLLIFIGAGRGIKEAEKRIPFLRKTVIKDIKFQKLTFITSEKISGFIILLVKIALTILKIIAFYIYITVVFSFFIWTEGYGQSLLLYVIKFFSIVGTIVLNYIPNLLFILAVIFINYYLLKFLYFIFDALDRKIINFPGFYSQWAFPTYKIVKFGLIALAVALIFPSLPGANTTFFKGVSVFLGLIVSLGSTGAVSNFIAGIILIYMNAFEKGDIVEIADVKGKIIDKALLITHIRTLKNVDITIPNSKVLGNHIINYSSAAKENNLILDTTITLGYDLPIDKVYTILKDSALATENILKDPSPFVVHKSLDDYYVSYGLNFYTDKPEEMLRILSKLHYNIHTKFNEEGLEILSPGYQALRDGNNITIPENYIPGDYKVPAFNIYTEKK